MTEASRNPLTTESAAGRRLLWYGVLMVIVLAAGVRFSHLTERELWLDESCTYYYVHHFFDWPADGPDRWLELTNVPYTFLLNLWTRAFGETVLGLRSFSAVAGCLAVVMVAGVGYRLGGGRAALAVGLLAAVHPLHVYYSQEARVYAFWTLELAVLLNLLCQAALTGKVRWWVAYTAVALGTVGTHYYTLFALPASIAGVVLAGNRRRFLGGWFVTHLFMLLVLAPFVWLVVLPLTGRGSQGWLLEVWQGYPPALAGLKSLWALLPSGGYPGEYLAQLVVAHTHAGEGGQALLTDVAVRWGPATVFLSLAVFGLIQAACSLNVKRGDFDQGAVKLRRCIPFLLVFVLGVLLVPWVYSLAVSPAYVVGRYDLGAWPGMVVLAGLLLEVVGRRRYLWWLLLGGLVACSALTVSGLHRQPVSQDKAQRVARLKQLVGEDDLVVSVNMYRWFLTYELDRQGFTARIISFPPAHDRQVGWQYAHAELADPAGIEAAVAETVDEVQHALSAGKHVWVLTQHGDPDSARFQVDSRLFAELQEAGVSLRVEDDRLGLVELVFATDAVSEPQ